MSCVSCLSCVRANAAGASRDHASSVGFSGAARNALGAMLLCLALLFAVPGRAAALTAVYATQGPDGAQDWKGVSGDSYFYPETFGTDLWVQKVHVSSLYVWQGEKSYVEVGWVRDKYNDPPFYQPAGALFVAYSRPRFVQQIRYIIPHKIYPGNWYNFEAVPLSTTPDANGCYYWHLHPDTADGPADNTAYVTFWNANPQSSAERLDVWRADGNPEDTNQVSFRYLKFRDFNVSWILWNDIRYYDMDAGSYLSPPYPGYGWDRVHRSMSSWHTVKMSRP